MYMTLNISYDAIQANHQPLTWNTNEKTVIFTHTCCFASHTQYPIYLNGWRVTYEDDQCWKSNTFQIARRQMLDIAYNISQDAIQAKQRPLTPSITRDMDI